MATATDLINQGNQMTSSTNPVEKDLLNEKKFAIVASKMANITGGWAQSNSSTAGTSVITADSFVETETTGQANLTDAPVEAHDSLIVGFNTFNKVDIPREVRLHITRTGKGPSDRQRFVKELEQLKGGVSLVDIVTPEIVHKNMSLISYHFTQTNRNGGVSMITANCIFREVRYSSGTASTFTGSGTTDIASEDPGASSPVNTGSRSTVPANPGTPGAN